MEKAQQKLDFFDTLKPHFFGNGVFLYAGIVTIFHFQTGLIQIIIEVDVQLMCY